MIDVWAVCWRASEKNAKWQSNDYFIPTEDERPTNMATSDVPQRAKSLFLG